MTVFEVAFPGRFLVKSDKEALELINKNISYNNVYITVYKFEKANGMRPDYDTAIIDKLFFDFDGEKSFSSLLKFHKFLLTTNILHKVNFSGGGFHLLLFVQPNDFKHKRDIILNVREFFSKKLDLVDDSKVKDLARYRRLENSFNFKRGSFCIPLSEDDLKLSFDEIKEKSKKQQFVEHYFGEKLLNISNFDRAVKVVLPFNLNEECEDFKVDAKKDCLLLINNINKTIEVPPFLLKIFDSSRKAYWDKNNGWTDRRLLILWLINKGLGFQECLIVLRELLTLEEFNHCIKEERQLEYLFKRVYERNDIFFPRADTLIKDGYSLSQTDMTIIDEYNNSYREFLINA